MSKGKRIMFAIMAWFVCHFTLHIAFAAVSTDNPPNGLIAVIDFLVAGAVYYWTGQKNKAETSVGENTEIEKIIRDAEIQPGQEVKIINKTEAEISQRNEKFIELLKSSISENGLVTIPDNDLIEIYKRAKSIGASGNNLDIEFSKAIDTLSEEIYKRGLSPEDKPQEIYTYKNSFLKQRTAGDGSKWVYAIAIPIIVIVIASVINKSFFSEAPKAPTFRLQDYYNKYKDFYGDIPLEDVAKDAYTRLEFNKDYATYDHFKKEVGIERLIQEDNDRRKPSFFNRLKKMKVPFPFRFSEEPINGILFRYDRFTGTVERQFGDTWTPQPRFKNLQHARDFMARIERNRQIRAIEEQTEAMEEQTREIRNSQIRQQSIPSPIYEARSPQSNIMKEYEENKLRQDVHDIKDTLERQERDRRMR